MSENRSDNPDRREFLTDAVLGAAALGGVPLTFGSLGRALGESVPQAAPFNMVVLGDSIMWGQGLNEEQKFSYKVARWIGQRLPGTEVRRHVLAHSGARILRDAAEDAKPPLHQEVPNHFPSVTKQLARFRTRPFASTGSGLPGAEAVSLVLLDGGINDFNTKTILTLDPTVGRSWVRAQTRERCVARMKQLLPSVVDTFPNAKVVVTNYFQIVSEQSNMVIVWELLRFWNVVGASLNAISAPLRKKLSDQSLAFHQESTAGFREAVAEVSGRLQAIANAGDLPVANANRPGRLEAVRPPPSRVVLAEAPFGPQNSYGAPDKYLFYMNEPDPAASERKPECVAQTSEMSLEFPNCLVAAVGHPNVRGAEAYAGAITDTLQRFVPEWRAERGLPALVTVPVELPPSAAPKPRRVRRP